MYSTVITQWIKLITNTYMVVMRIVVMTDHDNYYYYY